MVQLVICETDKPVAVQPDSAELPQIRVRLDQTVGREVHLSSLFVNP
ncbi:Uncharacterised protein [Mycobacteroides abscessus subsp. abscessus]|nr:Uncharacterised protein [Mycobacteroides abscessus subsp. abscessus]